ncbi:hypothetical protein Hanom_Chr07g00599501 [Helianthus anomalus]
MYTIFVKMHTWIYNKWALHPRLHHFLNVFITMARHRFVQLQCGPPDTMIKQLPSRCYCLHRLNHITCSLIEPC